MFKAPPLVVRMHSFPENFWSEILFQSTKEEYPLVIIDDGVIARRKISWAQIHELICPHAEVFPKSIVNNIEISYILYQSVAEYTEFF